MEVVGLSTGSRIAVGIDEMFPAGGVVVLDDRGHDLGGVEGGAFVVIGLAR